MINNANITADNPEFFQRDQKFSKRLKIMAGRKMNKHIY